MNEKLFKLLFAQFAIIGLFACQKTNFSPVTDQFQTSLETPIDGVLRPQPVLSKGQCAADSSTVLTSCQNCLVPAVVNESQFSRKGKSFIDIMAIGCSIPNRSAPAGYVPPTRDELVRRYNRLSPTLYPDSEMSEYQISVIEGLKSDTELQNYMFSGLWYRPPKSDAFETYFGLEVAEAVYQVCYQHQDSIFTPYNSTLLLSKEYLDCTYNNNWTTCQEQQIYNEANVYRNQLRNAMIESLRNPYQPTTPNPAISCDWEKFEGFYDLGGADQIQKWLSAGHIISLEIKGEGGSCGQISSLPSGSQIPSGEVVIGAYKCQ